jgi:hypothetical protein
MPNLFISKSDLLFFFEIALIFPSLSLFKQSLLRTPQPTGLAARSETPLRLSVFFATPNHNIYKGRHIAGHV